MSKQTAVEWLFDQLPDELRLSQNGFDMLQQAKTMEREQIEHAWHDGHSPYGHFFVGNYLEKTYGKEASNES